MLFTKEWLIKDWIASNVQPRKTVNKRISSYGLKHVVERDIKEYVSNDELIAAMEAAGYVKWQPAVDSALGSPNFFFRAKYKPLTRGAT